MDHKEMDVWKKGMDLVKKIYELTADFPIDEKYEHLSRCNEP
jgi:hypothetical protein